jgi:outer membrane receptor protein involved in Fe transport
LAKDGLSITRGNHSFRMGGEINWFRYTQDSCSRGCNGIYEFRSLADLLTATPRRFEVMLPGGESPVRHLRQLFSGMYFQGNWQVLPTLTFNLGLRYEFATVISDDDGFVSNLRNFFDPNVSVSTTTAQAYPGQTFSGTIDQFFTNPTLKSFSPRFGFAWAPGSRKTSLRGGFGIFYEHPMLYQLRTALQELPPFTLVGRADTSAATPLRFPDAFTTQQSLLRGRPNIRTLEYDMKTTYIYRWSLTLQREFLNEWMVSAGYTGSRAVHFVQQTLGNIRRWEGFPDNPTGPKFFQPGAPLLNPTFGEMRMQSPNGNSFYHGLQVGASKRLSHGVQMQLAYNYSHAIDQGSGVTQTGEALPQGQRGVYYWDTQMKRGPAAFDIKHTFGTNFSYEPTFGQNLTGVAGHIAKGWQLNGVLSLIGGHPLTVFDDENDAQIARIGDAENVRANLIPGGNNNPTDGVAGACAGTRAGKKLGTPDIWYDPCQFTASTTGFFGNLGPGTVRSPGLATVDFSVFKNFNVSETNQVQFRAEFFNFFNRVNLHTPDMDAFNATGQYDTNAARIELTRTPARQIQFALKYIF